VTFIRRKNGQKQHRLEILRDSLTETDILGKFHTWKKRTFFNWNASRWIIRKKNGHFVDWKICREPLFL